MFSFKLLPSGRETLIHMRTLSGCGIAKIEFALKFAMGGAQKGLATKPFLIQEAMESVTAAPCVKAALEFFTTQGPMYFFFITR
jgi:hypothetical protein